MTNHIVCGLVSLPVNLTMKRSGNTEDEGGVIAPKVPKRHTGRI